MDSLSRATGVVVTLVALDFRHDPPGPTFGPLVEFLVSCERLKFDGLMVLPPFFEDAEQTRPFFKKLRAIRDAQAVRNTFANGKGELSMGMSHDFEVAIEEGATLVRVGTAIFGSRG